MQIIECCSVHVLLCLHSAPYWDFVADLCSSIPSTVHVSPATGIPERGRLTLTLRLLGRDFDEHDYHGVTFYPEVKILQLKMNKNMQA